MPVNVSANFDHGSHDDMATPKPLSSQDDLTQARNEMADRSRSSGLPVAEGSRHGNTVNNLETFQIYVVPPTLELVELFCDCCWRICYRNRTGTNCIQWASKIQCSSIPARRIRYA
jgi:hypothetical protein